MRRYLSYDGWEDGEVELLDKEAVISEDSLVNITKNGQKKVYKVIGIGQDITIDGQSADIKQIIYLNTNEIT